MALLQKEKELHPYVSAQKTSHYGLEDYRLEPKDWNKIFSPGFVTKKLLIITSALLAGHVLICEVGLIAVGYINGWSYSTQIETFYWALYKQFYLASDGNIATYFSSFILGFASFLLYTIHGMDRWRTNHWRNLSAVLLFLSLDEAVQLHETLGGLVGQIIHSPFKSVPPAMAWAWMTPYAALALLLGLYFLRFTLNLPQKTKYLFLLSGCVYVFAALGLEFMESYFDTVYGPSNNYNRILFPLEEILEMVGIVLLIFALLDYLSLNRKSLQVKLKSV